MACSSITNISERFECQLGELFANLSPFIMVFTILVYTGLIVWGTQRLSLVLNGDDDGNGNKRNLDIPIEVEGENTRTPEPKMSGLRSALASDEGDKDQLEITKISVFLGSIGIAALFVGIGYWIVFSLFLSPEKLQSLESIWIYFLSGSAMFLPYAFDRLSKLFGA